MRSLSTTGNDCDLIRAWAISRIFRRNFIPLRNARFPASAEARVLAAVSSSKRLQSVPDSRNLSSDKRSISPGARKRSRGIFHIHLFKWERSRSNFLCAFTRRKKVSKRKYNAWESLRVTRHPYLEAHVCRPKIFIPDLTEERVAPIKFISRK